MPEKKILSENIRAIRKKAHLSQFEFAEDCGISKDTLSLIERGKYNPSVELLQMIASYCGVTVSELLQSDNEPKERAEKTAPISQGGSL